MKNIRIANRYSKALFTLSIEQHLLEIVKEDMALIAAAFKQTVELKKVLLSPVIKEDKKINIVHQIFQPNINAFTLRFIDIIISKNRFIYIDFIAEEFLKLYRASKNIALAEIQTAVTIDAGARSKIIEILRGFTKKEIELVEELRSELIGGFLLKIDDIQYDTSIRSKLLKMKKEFSVNTYEKGL